MSVQPKLVKVRRIEAFSAAHRLHNSEMSAEENRRVFGKCNTRHGHNYKVEVEVCGSVQASTGMVINISDLKRLIGDVLADLDHNDLNELDHFKAGNIPTTAENIVCYIFDQLNPKISQLSQDLALNARLTSVVLHETDKNIVQYEG